MPPRGERRVTAPAGQPEPGTISEDNDMKTIPLWVGPTLAGIGVGCLCGVLGDFGSAIAGMVITFVLLMILEAGADLRRMP